MSHRSGHYSEYPHAPPSPRARPERRRAAPPPVRPPPQRRRRRLHAGACRQAGPRRPGGVLDRRRHHRRARHVVGGHRHLFRLSRRRADPAGRPPGGDAIRLRRPHRRTARARSTAPPAGSCSIRNSSNRSSTRSSAGRPRSSQRTTALGAMPDNAPTGSIRPPGRGAAARRPDASGTPKPSPISDTVIFVAPPDREARLESRAPRLASRKPIEFAKVQGVDNVLARLQMSLDSVERRQMAALDSVEDSFESRMRRMRGVVHRSRPRHGAAGEPQRRAPASAARSFR